MHCFICVFNATFHLYTYIFFQYVRKCLSFKLNHFVSVKVLHVIHDIVVCMLFRKMSEKRNSFITENKKDFLAHENHIVYVVSHNCTIVVSLSLTFCVQAMTLLKHFSLMYFSTRFFIVMYKIFSHKPKITLFLVFHTYINYDTFYIRTLFATE